MREQYHTHTHIYTYIYYIYIYIYVSVCLCVSVFVCVRAYIVFPLYTVILGEFKICHIRRAAVDEEYINRPTVNLYTNIMTA